MSEDFVVQSHRGPYAVRFVDGLTERSERLLAEGTPHFLVDGNVARLYARQLGPVLSHATTVVIEATEENKAIQQVIPVFERLVANRMRRDHTLVAIGGGIVQDVCCFVASTLLRGVPWRFLPTTLLAQADSCIGSKSSINLGSVKNIIGTFHPPADVLIDVGFLDTLEPKEIRSGIGEILKVHAIEGAPAFDALARDFAQLTTDRAVLLRYVAAALRIKQRFIELDEFDRGPRNIFNYGHSFGHAIESATNYGIPHGIAVSIGMDMANYVAAERGTTPRDTYARMHPTLRDNYAAFAGATIPFDGMFAALLKDKKNSATRLGLILPVGPEAVIQKVDVPPDDAFRAQCAAFLGGLR